MRPRNTQNDRNWVVRFLFLKNEKPQKKALLSLFREFRFLSLKNVLLSFAMFVSLVDMKIQIITILKFVPSLIFFSLFIYSCQNSSEKINHTSNDYQLQPIPFNQVTLQDDFWKPRLKTQKETLVPFALDKTLPAVENLQKAGKYLKGDTTDLPFPHRYISSDLYKVMEGAALLLMENPDPELEKRMDGIIDIIADAQREDGYLYVAHITGVSKDHDHWGGEEWGINLIHSWCIAMSCTIWGICTRQPLPIIKRQVKING